LSLLAARNKYMMMMMIAMMMMMMVMYLLSCQHLSRPVIDQHSRVMLLWHTVPLLPRRISALPQVLSQDHLLFSVISHCTYNMRCF